MEKIYWTYRPKRLSNPFELWNISLNWVYSPSFFLDNSFADYKAAGLTKIIDWEIHEENYTAEIAPWVPKLTRFISAFYNENYINWDDFAKSIQAVWAEFQIETLTPWEAILWIRNNTNLQEVEPGKFLLSESSEWIEWQIEAKYLIIE